MSVPTGGVEISRNLKPSRQPLLVIGFILHLFLAGAQMQPPVETTSIVVVSWNVRRQILSSIISEAGPPFPVLSGNPVGMTIPATLPGAVC